MYILALTHSGRMRRGRGALGPAVMLAVSALSLLAGCGDGRTPLVLYSPHGRDLLKLVEETYEAAHPDVDVRWLFIGSQEIYDRARTEAANPQGDVWYGGPSEILAHAVRDQLLEPYRPSWADSVPAASRHPEDYYFGLYRTPPLLVYNEAAVSPEDAPKDWDDLLDERWQGKVLIRDPLPSGTMRTLFCMILARSLDETGSTDQGFEWLRRLDAQTREYVHSPALLHQKMIRQEGLVTMWTLTDILIQRQRGAPLAYTFPTSGSPVIDDSIALIKGSRHADEARAFIDWVGEREAQILAMEKAFRLPTRTDLPREDLPEWARDAADHLVVAHVDQALLDERSVEWLETWDRTIRGKGGSN